MDLITAGHFAIGFGLWTIIRLTSKNSDTAFGLFFGLFPTQICLATAWATFSPERAWVRFGRLAWHLLIAYFLVLLFNVIAGPRYLKTLWFTPLMIALFVIPMLMISAVVRWFGWRLVCDAKNPIDLEPEAKFRLIDAWRWSTQICLLLAVMTSFREDIKGWDDLGYVILFVVAAWECVPAAMIVSLTWWLTMCTTWSKVHAVLVAVLSAAWLLLITLAAVRNSQEFPYFVVWLMLTVSLATAGLTAMFARREGWRMSRIRSSHAVQSSMNLNQ